MLLFISKYLKIICWLLVKPQCFAFYFYKVLLHTKSGLFGNIFIGSSLARRVAAATPHQEEKNKQNQKTNNNSIGAFHLICKISISLINIIVMIIVVASVATI